MHAFNQRVLAEDLVRVRRPDDRERYAAAQRQARIDPNPHQIDAVIFALRRLREGGCILADEVGLGKTIEAGLVIAQRRAEGAQRILLIVPKSLIGQWQGELLNLFGIEALENEVNFFPPGVYLVGREFAGSERGAIPLGAAPPFDLAVIDEAHEIFAGLHKRYDRDGIYDETSTEAVMAHRVRGFLRSTPVLLLTATPMQNSLVELWGLVQYVEPTGTLLGDIVTFREVFCTEDDRSLVPGQEHELKRRLALIQRRTLRRQAQEFLDRPFTRRRCRLYEYAMSDAERSRIGVQPRVPNRSPVLAEVQVRIELLWRDFHHDSGHKAADKRNVLWQVIQHRPPRKAGVQMKLLIKVVEDRFHFLDRKDLVCESLEPAFFRLRNGPSRRLFAAGLPETPIAGLRKFYPDLDDKAIWGGSGLGKP